MNVYDTERIVIGTVLKYGNQAAKHILPDLRPDRFIYGKNEDFGGIFHSQIWSRITKLVMEDQVEPTVSLVGIDESYLNHIIRDLDNRYGIFHFDPETLMHYAETVDKAGVVYAVYLKANELNTLGLDEGIFHKNIDRIEDLHLWLASIQEDLGRIYSTETEGYKHISYGVEQTLDTWDRQWRGEQIVIIPSGWPTMMEAQLFPRGTLAILHGMSGTGKSSVLLQVLTGTAFGLVMNDVPGCVAMNSLEMSYTSLVSRIAAFLSGVDHTRLRGGKKKLTPDEYKRLTEWAELVAKLPIYVDDTNMITTTAMRYRSSALHTGENGPVHQLGSDYTELFVDDEGDNKEQHVGNVIRKQFFISRLLNASVIAISQSTYKDTSTYIAGQNGLRYSRAGTQAADIIVELWNPIQMEANGLSVTAPDHLDKTSAWMLVEKYRDGSPCQFRLGWEAEFTRFSDVALSYQHHKQPIYDFMLERDKLIEKFGTIPDVKDVVEWA